MTRRGRSHFIRRSPTLGSSHSAVLYALQEHFEDRTHRYFIYCLKWPLVSLFSQDRLLGSTWRERSIGAFGPHREQAWRSHVDRESHTITDKVKHERANFPIARHRQEIVELVPAGAPSPPQFSTKLRAVGRGAEFLVAQRKVRFAERFYQLGSTNVV